MFAQSSFLFCTRFAGAKVSRQHVRADYVRVTPPPRPGGTATDLRVPSETANLFLLISAR